MSSYNVVQLVIWLFGSNMSKNVHAHGVILVGALLRNGQVIPAPRIITASAHEFKDLAVAVSLSDRVAFTVVPIAGSR